MGTYAHIQDGAVLDIIVADAEHIAERPALVVGEWVAVPEGQTAFIRGKYDKETNKFSEPPPSKPPPPDDGKEYEWDSAEQEWKEVT